MDSRIATELKLRHVPVAIIFTSRPPKEALKFKEGRWGCVIAMLQAAADGKTAVFDRRTTGCTGGSVGLGFRKSYEGFPGGIEYFLSTGRGAGFREGEGYKKTPELARVMVEALPTEDIPFDYVVFKPLPLVDQAEEEPVLVTFLANPDQLSALVVLANYGRPTNDNVIITMAAGCQQMCLLPYIESRRESPRAMVGIMDVSARPRVDPDILSFTVPWSMFREMEANVPGSFLERKAWRALRDRIPDPGALR